MKHFWIIITCLLTVTATAQQYEAENASYSGELTNSSSDYKGTGVALTDAAHYVNFSFSLSAQGSYKIYIGYSSPYGDKPVNVSINGSSKSITAYESAFCTELLCGTYTLNSGSNSVIITPDWTYFMIDYLRIESTSGNNSDSETGSTGLTVSGSKLLDANGNEFVMRGVNMAYAWYKQYSYSSQLEAIARAGANTVRIALSDGGKWTKDDAGTVAGIISKCESLKMIAVLEVHDATGSDETEDLSTAANYFAELKDVLSGHEKTVIINIANEWVGAWNASLWKTGYVQAIGILRNAGLKHCLMIDAAGWGQYPVCIQQYGSTVLNADSEKNIIFSIHMYGSAGKTSAVESNIDNVIDQNLALCIGEFGWYHSDGDVDEDLILSYTKSKNVGWLAWSWWGNGSGVNYLDLVQDKYDETSVYTQTTNSQSCNWGEKIIGAMKSEATTCSVFTTTNHVPITLAETTIYPTRISEQLTIECTATCNITIFDCLGHTVWTQNNTNGTQTVNCNNWPNGIYIITVWNKNEYKQIKVIK